MVLRESVGSGGTQAELDLLREPFLLGFEPRDFLLRHLRQFGFRRFALEQRAVFVQVGGGFQIGVAAAPPVP